MGRRARLYALTALLISCLACSATPPASPTDAGEEAAPEGSLLREATLAADAGRVLEPGEVALLSLEHSRGHPSDLGPSGVDEVRVRLAGKRLCLDEGLSHRAQLFDGEDAVASLQPGQPCVRPEADGPHLLRLSSLTPGGSTVSAAYLRWTDDALHVDRGCPGCDLDGADLTNLAGALVGDHGGASLKKARFDGSRVGCDEERCVDFAGADLTGAQPGCSTWGVQPAGSNHPAPLVDLSAPGLGTASWSWPEPGTCRVAFASANVDVQTLISGAATSTFTFGGIEPTSLIVQPPLITGIQSDSFRRRDLGNARIAGAVFTAVESGGEWGLNPDAPDFSESTWTAAQVTDSWFTNQPYRPSVGPEAGCEASARDDAPVFSDAEFNLGVLDGSVFAGAALDSTSFEEATLHGAVFCGARTERPSFFMQVEAGRVDGEAVRPAADFTNSSLGGSSFENASLQGVDFGIGGAGYADLTGVDFTGSVLDDAVFSGANLGGNATFGQARSARQVTLNDTSLLGIDFGTLDMSSAGGMTNLAGAAVCGAAFDRANLAGAVLATIALVSTPGGAPGSGSGTSSGGSYTLADGSRVSCLSPFPPEAVTRDAVSCPDGNKGQAPSGSCSQQQWEAAATAQVPAPQPAACCTSGAGGDCPLRKLDGFPCSSDAECFSCNCATTCQP